MGSVRARLNSRRAGGSRRRVRVQWPSAEIGRPQHQFLASPDPVSKKDMTFRSVTTYDTPDHYTSVFYMVMPNGSEMKNMEMIGRRVK